MTGQCTSHFHRRPWYRKWVLWRRLIAGLFLTVLILGQFEWFVWLRGNTSGTTLFNVVPMTDPLAALEMLIATHSLTLSVMLGAGILILVGMVFGPIFCGFVCPLGLVLDLNHTLRRVVRKRVFKKSKRIAVTRKVPVWSRYAILGFLIGFVLISGLPVFQALSPINLLVRALVMGSYIGLVIIGLIMVLEWFLPRVWCRALCPLGACYSIVGRKGIWRVRINPQTAGQIHCKQCEIRCPMGVAVMNDYTLAGQESVSHPSCIRCGDCIDICPNTVLGLRWRPFSFKQTDVNDRDVHLPVLESPTAQASESACGACE